MDKPFRIYRNLNNETWTIQKYNEEKKGYRKDGQAPLLLTKTNHYKVYSSGKERVRLEGKKNVHAYIECAGVMGFGEEDELERWFTESTGRLIGEGEYITYDPYKDDCFHFATGGPVGYTDINVFTREGKVFNVVPLHPEPEEESEDNDNDSGEY